MQDLTPKWEAGDSYISEVPTTTVAPPEGLDINRYAPCPLGKDYYVDASDRGRTSSGRLEHTTSGKDTDALSSHQWARGVERGLERKRWALPDCGGVNMQRQGDDLSSDRNHKYERRCEQLLRRSRIWLQIVGAAVGVQAMERMMVQGEGC